MRISDWSSDVGSSDLRTNRRLTINDRWSVICRGCVVGGLEMNFPGCKFPCWFPSRSALPYTRVAKACEVLALPDNPLSWFVITDTLIGRAPVRVRVCE